MKKLLLIVFLGFGTAAYAQVEKGDINATANVNFSSQKFKDFDDAMNMTNFNIRGGYYFTNNIEAGISFTISGTKMGDLIDQTTVGYGPYAVYNFLTSDGKLLPDVGANFLHMDMGQEGIDPINQIGAFGGVKYFLTEVVNIDTNLNYTSWLGDIEGSSIILNVGIGINFGKLK
jgi:hypothetical protein